VAVSRLYRLSQAVETINSMTIVTDDIGALCVKACHRSAGRGGSWPECVRNANGVFGVLPGWRAKQDQLSASSSVAAAQHHHDTKITCRRDGTSRNPERHGQLLRTCTCSAQCGCHGDGQHHDVHATTRCMSVHGMCRKCRCIALQCACVCACGWKGGRGPCYR